MEIVTTKYVYVSILKICKYVNLHGKKKTLQMLLRSRILIWGHHPGLPRWAQCNQNDASKKEAGGSKSRVGDEMMDGGACLCKFLWWGVEEVGGRRGRRGREKEQRERYLKMLCC